MNTTGFNQPSSDQTDFEQQLGNTLEHHAGNADLTPQGLSDVRGRARGIRRRRRAVGAAGLAAALAVTVPAGLWANRVLDGTSDSSIVASETPPPVTDPVTIGADAPAGDPPELAWVEGRRVHLTDTTIATDRAFDQVALVGDRVLVHVLAAEGDGEMFELADDGTATSLGTALTPPVVDAERSAAAWLDEDRDIVWADAAGERTFPTDTDVMVSSVDADGVWVSPDGTPGPVRRINSDGIPGGTIDAIQVQGSLAGRATVTTSIDEHEPSTCGGVWSGDEMLWETCDNSLGMFAPGGDWVLGSDPYFDGMGQTIVAVLDADSGEMQVEYRAGEDIVVIDQRWEDSEHVLALTYAMSEQSWQVVRLGLDGSIEQAVASRKGGDFDPPFRLGS